MFHSYDPINMLQMVDSNTKSQAFCVKDTFMNSGGRAVCLLPVTKVTVHVGI